METVDKEKIAIALLKIINEKREEIKKLTSEIMELEDDPKNVVKIKQNVHSILNAVVRHGQIMKFAALIRVNVKAKDLPSVAVSL